MSIVILAWHLRLRQYYPGQEVINEHNDPNLAETPHYKEKQTILPNPISAEHHIEKKPHTPVKRTHDGKLKKEKKDLYKSPDVTEEVISPSDKIKIEEAKIDMRKLIVKHKSHKTSSGSSASKTHSSSSTSSSHHKKDKHKSVSGSEHHRSHSSKTSSSSSKYHKDKNRKSSSSSAQRSSSLEKSKQSTSSSATVANTTAIDTIETIDKLPQTAVPSIIASSSNSSVILPACAEQESIPPTPSDFIPPPLPSEPLIDICPPLPPVDMPIDVPPPPPPLNDELSLQSEFVAKNQDSIVPLASQFTPQKIFESTTTNTPVKNGSETTSQTSQSATPKIRKSSSNNKSTSSSSDLLSSIMASMDSPQTPRNSSTY